MGCGYSRGRGSSFYVGHHSSPKVDHDLPIETLILYSFATMLTLLLALILGNSIMNLLGMPTVHGDGKSTNEHLTT